jgi:hypothetical protein
MLKTSNLIGFGSGGGAAVSGFDDKFSTAITTAGLAANAQIILDFGDSACVGAAGDQTYLNLGVASENSFRGATVGAEGSDPTFNAGGTPGNLSINEYIQGDGGDYSRFTAKPTWIDPFHKTGAKWGAIFGHYCIDATTRTGMFGNGKSSSFVGVTINITSSEFPQIAIHKGSAVTAANIWGVSVDEPAGSGGSFWFVNGATETFDGAYDGATPSSSAATYTPEFMARGNASDIMESGHRLYFAAIFDTNPSTSEMDTIWGLMRTRLSL